MKWKTYHEEDVGQGDVGDKEVVIRGLEDNTVVKIGIGRREERLKPDIKEASNVYLSR